MKNRNKLAIANYCRAFLYIHGFISDAEDDRIHKRIREWQDDNKIEITEEEILSVEIVVSRKKEE